MRGSCVTEAFLWGVVRGMKCYILLLSANPPKDVKHPPEPLEDRGSGFAF